MIAPRHTRPPIPPDHGGEPPVTREFNRWLYGLVLPGAVFLWSLFILAGGRFTFRSGSGGGSLSI